MVDGSFRSRGNSQSKGFSLLAYRNCEDLMFYSVGTTHYSSLDEVELEAILQGVTIARKKD